MEFESSDMKYLRISSLLYILKQNIDAIIFEIARCHNMYILDK